MDSQLPQRFGGGGETNIHPAVLATLLLVAVLILLLPRRHVILPFLAATFLIPNDQLLIIGPFHFGMMRILVTLGWVRLIMVKASSRSKLFSGGMNAIDKAMIFCCLFGAMDFVLLWRETGALINQLGYLYTTLGAYCFLRFFIGDQEDAERTIRAFAYIALPIAAIMISEHATGHNPYTFLGGGLAAARATLMRREHGIRAMGSFQHPITAGVFGAILLPLFLGVWWKAESKRLSMLVGMVAATTIVVTSVSSTGLMAFVAAVVGLSFWPLRGQMRAVRWGILLALVSLHMVMKAPVWFLIGHLDVIGGSDSWHRAEVIDVFIRRFGNWWLLGTKDNYNWGWGMWDLTNQYVATGLTGGVVPFLFFLAVLVHGFKYLGRARRVVEGDKRQTLFIWALCAGLLANTAAFFGVIYFDQIQVAWYAFLAIVSAVTGSILQPQVTGAGQDTRDRSVGVPALKGTAA